MPRWVAILAAFGVVVCAGPATAQERPTVFVHGLNGSPSTWQAAAERLRNGLEISTYVPGVPWTQHFETQAGNLQSQLSNLPASTVAIGHSNGGIVSRQWSRQHPLSGLLTVGAPQQGAPLVKAALSALGFHESLYYSAGAVFAALGAQPNQWWDVYLYVELALALTQNLGFDAYYKVAGLGILANYPVLSQMATGSAYLNQLNSSSNLAREASAIPARQRRLRLRA